MWRLPRQEQRPGGGGWWRGRLRPIGAGQEEVYLPDAVVRSWRAAVSSAGERTAGASDCGGGGWEELGGGLDMIEQEQSDTKCYGAARGRAQEGRPGALPTAGGKREGISFLILA